MTERLSWTPSELDRFRSAVHGRLGLRFDEGKLGFLAEVLGRRLEVTGRSPAIYLSSLEVPAVDRQELRALAQELTVTETYFFRNAEQFRALAEVALPPRAHADKTRRPFRILSAGCASGEEAYSLAIFARDQSELACYETSIRGIDVNASMLQRAAKARYSAWALRGTAIEIQSRYFRADGRELILDAGVRAAVTFEERNLVEDDPTFWRPGAFDVIFCRNVLMYFAPETAQAVVARLGRSLVPGGFLFLGFAETLRGLSQDFHLRHTHGTFYYQRRETERLSSPELFGGGLPARGPPSTRSEELEPTAETGGPFYRSDVSWIETIRHASERIEALTSPSPRVAALGIRTGAQPPSPIRATFDLSPAVELIRQERFGEAQAMLIQLPLEATRDPDVLLLRAVLLTHGGDLAAAETLCQEVLALEEMSAGAHYLTALCREDAGDRLGAADHDRVASYLDPGFAMPHLHLGLLARRTGDRGAARRELGDALALLQREDAWRLLLFGGGFGREGLIALCRAELTSCGGAP